LTRTLAPKSQVNACNGDFAITIQTSELRA
jgi:hypothetical protein